ELVPVGALHENRDRLGDRAVAVENVIHVLRDRRLDAELLRERVAGGRGVEALGHGALAREVNAPVGAPRDLLPERPIARLATREREDEMANPRHAEEREWVRAEGDAEPRDLGEPARDERRPGVRAELEAVAGASRDRDHVLEGPADLHADRISARIRAEGRGVE